MNAVSKRVFEDAPAVRGATPLLFGLIGPSSSGKTFSALRLATGVQRIVGGEIFVADTEKNRAKHYADHFAFRHVPFSPPFSPDDYIDVIDHCESKGAKTLIIDSMSHEHSGLGGVLEWHQAEVERIMAAWRCNEEKANIPAWGKPKAARRRLINRITQSSMNFILCFRAKDKIKVGSGKVVQLGWMPDAGEEFVFELTAKALLLPGAGGVPTLQSAQVGEQMMIKIPEQFRNVFNGSSGKPLSEDFGEQMALWSTGQDLTVASYDACPSDDALKVLEKRRKDLWPKLSTAQKSELKVASERATKRIADMPKAPPPTVINTADAPVQTVSAETPTTDIPTWVETLNGQETAELLDQAYEACSAAFNGNPPNECHAAYTLRREALTEKLDV